MATETSESKTNQRSAQRRKSASKPSGSSSQSAPDPTKSESKVAARQRLDEGTSVASRLEQRAKDQEKQQAKELKDGVATGDEKKAAERRAKVGEADRASVLAGGPIETPNAPGLQGGWVDQLTRRHGNEALTGHFVKIDLNHKDVPDALKESGADYGVFLEAATTDPDTGYPVTARVRLRDETHAEVVVPYEALRPTEQRGR